jgi:hypothetical protein
MKLDECADVIMGTLYRDIDLDESPIVVLGCGHHWIIETLDGNVGLGDVYGVDPRSGRFDSFIENLELQAKVPKCPGGCGLPIRQFVTQRYNRLINKAVIAEQSRRFIATGMQELQELEGKASKLHDDLDKTRNSFVPTLGNIGGLGQPMERAIAKAKDDLDKKIKARYTTAIKLSNDVKAFQHRSSAQHQPVNKLHDAIAHFTRAKATLDDVMANLSLSAPPATPKPHPDLRINLGGRLLELKISCVVLEDKFGVTRIIEGNFPSATSPIKLPGGPLTSQSAQFLSLCKELSLECVNNDLPKLAVESILYYARIAQTLGSSGLAQDSDRTKAMEYRETAKALLDQAQQLCKDAFRDRDTLLKAVKSSRELLNKDFYEEVSAEELKAIKQAMVTGRGGISTHSGHWYKC